MNQKELDTLRAILNPSDVKDKISARLKALRYLDTVEITEEPKYPTRTDPQRRGYFLWLEQIAKQCENMGVTADMLFKHTAHITVTKDMLHTAIKTLIKAKWNLDSTNDLRKTGHLDEIIDSVASWVGKEGVEIPPFPTNETKAWEQLSGEKIGSINNLKNESYPKMTEDLMANKF